VEVAKSHESWDRLRRDADEKHFSAITGIVVFLGIKIYPSKRMRIMLLERDHAQGFGAAHPPLVETGFIDTTTPSPQTIVIPKRLIYYGVAPNSIPPTITPDYNLRLELIRKTIDKYWEA
jgi:hypothetical protein